MQFPDSDPAAAALAQGSKMRTSVIHGSGTRLVHAFEVENLYIGRTDLFRLLLSNADVQARPLAGDLATSDVVAVFTYRGVPCIVLEPFGDNSRYWIGPDSDAAGPAPHVDLHPLHELFARYQPSLFRELVADILSFRLPLFQRLVRRRPR